MPTRSPRASTPATLARRVAHRHALGLCDQKPPLDDDHRAWLEEASRLLALSSENPLKVALLGEDGDAVVAKLGHEHLLALDGDAARVLELPLLAASRAKGADVFHRADVVDNDAPVDVVGDECLSLVYAHAVRAPQLARLLRAVRARLAKWRPVTESELLHTVVAALDDKELLVLARNSAWAPQLAIA